LSALLLAVEAAGYLLGLVGIVMGVRAASRG
jgi:hypothetical protein